MELEAKKGFNISNNDFIKICPFYFCLDEHLVVIDLGPSAAKLFGNVLGMHIHDIITINRNSNQKFETFLQIVERLNDTQYFNSKKIEEEIQFKGQFCSFSKNQLTLIFSPIIEDEEHLRVLNLDFSDFPSQDTTLEYHAFLSKKKKEFDITAYQDELLTANYRLNSLLNTMQSGVIAEDADRKVLLVNAKFCNMFSLELQPEDLKGLDCIDLSVQAKSLFVDEDGFLKDIHELVSNKKDVYGDILHLKDGSILERDYVPIIESGRFLGQIWRYQDITKIVNQKKSLLRIEEKYRRIIEDLEFGLIEVDLDQNITKAYPAFCRMTEYSEPELIGKNAKQLLLDPEFESIVEAQNESRIKGDSSVYEIKIRTKSNKPKWVIISGTPIYNDRNEIIGSIGIHIDITERKGLEEALKLANEKANSSVKAKEIFIANMSHEIRTPMNVIIGMTDVLKTIPMDTEGQKYLAAVAHSAENLLRLINEILDISKAESGLIDLFPEPIDLNAFIDELGLSFGEYAKRKGLVFEVYTDPKIASFIHVDQVKLNQVLVNLIGNGIKFTQNGTVSLAVSLIKDQPQSLRLKIAVKDTGIGIKNENFDAIFESFRQEDASIGRKFGGTGLGLSISQAIVKKMGGNITLTSEIGKGSEFSFIIDVDKVNVSDIQMPVLKELVVPEHLKSKKIIVAEDDELNQQLIGAIFKKYDLSFVIAKNGRDVLDFLKKEHFDLILMDINMPELNGLETTRIIREEWNLNIPIIALTAHESESDLKLFRNIGINDHISKPYKKESLFDVLSKQFEISVDLKASDKSVFEESEKLYSLHTLQEMSQGDTGFLTSIVETFVLNTPVYMEQIETAFDTKDFNMVYRAAHQMKPSIDFFNIEKGKHLVRAIEMEAKSENPNLIELASQIKDLKNIVIICVDALKDELLRGF
jgi:PAS domain S-box-containing protein